MVVTVLMMIVIIIISSSNTTMFVVITNNGTVKENSKDKTLPPPPPTPCKYTNAQPQAQSYDRIGACNSSYSLDNFGTRAYSMVPNDGLC